MKNTLTILPWILCLLMLAYIGQCTHKGKEKVCPETKDSIRVDTIVKTIEHTQYYPKPIADTVYYPETVYLPADTAELIAECKRIAFEYYKSKIYNRHLVIDSIGFIDLRDSVTKNELYGYAVKSQFKQLTINTVTERTILTKPKNKLLAGLILSGNKDVFGATPSLMWQTKKSNTYLIGYDVIQKNYTVGVYVKLF